MQIYYSLFLFTILFHSSVAYIGFVHRYILRPGYLQDCNRSRLGELENLVPRGRSEVEELTLMTTLAGSIISSLDGRGQFSLQRKQQHISRQGQVVQQMYSTFSFSFLNSHDQLRPPVELEAVNNVNPQDKHLQTPAEAICYNFSIRLLEPQDAHGVLRLII